LAKEIDLARYNSLVRLTYAAGLDSDRWSEVLAGISNLVGHVRLALNGHDSDRNNVLGFLSHNYDPSFHTSYVRHFASTNPWNAIVPKLPVGRAVRSQSVLAPESLRRTEFYADWIRPQEDVGTGAGITLFKDSARFLRISANIRFRDQERLQEPLVTVLDHLGPHITASFDLARQLMGARVASNYTAALERVPGAVFLLDCDCRVTLLNSTADQLQSVGSQLKLTGDGRLFFLEPATQQAFLASVSEIVSGVSTGPVSAVVRGTWAPRLEVVVAPFVPESRPVDVPLRIVVDDQPVVIVIVDVQRQASDHLAAFSRRCGLTTTERELAEHLYAGRTVFEFSEVRKVSLHTARNQLRALMGKVGVSRQAELVSAIAQALRREPLARP
jgi:DNA-binding CsgD family transcriptional regulator